MGMPNSSSNRSKRHSPSSNSSRLLANSSRATAALGPTLASAAAMYRSVQCWRFQLTCCAAGQAARLQLGWVFSVHGMSITEDHLPDQVAPRTQTSSKDKRLHHGLCYRALLIARSTIYAIYAIAQKLAPYQQRQPAPEGRWQHDMYRDVEPAPRRAPVSQAAPLQPKL